MSALVVALAGTDHHRFDRLVQWIDDAAVRLADVRFVVQHGSSAAPLVAEGHEFLAHGRLVALLEEAAVVVCHGGPGTILDARAAGHVPICVPRDPRLGEHVDGHQQRFAALVAEAGIVHAVSSLESFLETLDRSLEQGRSLGSTDVTSARDAARARLAAELDQLLTVPPRRGRLSRARV